MNIGSASIVKNAAKKKMTLDDLAAMIKRQFDFVDNRFDKIDARFDAIDKRFDGVDKRFDDSEQRFERRFQEIEDTMNTDFRPRIRALEKEVGIWD